MEPPSLPNPGSPKFSLAQRRFHKQQRPRPKWLKCGAELEIPRGESDFGRFGFDEERVVARSFLYFTMNTVFPSTRFAGVQRTIRIDETGDERVERKVRPEAFIP